MNNLSSNNRNLKLTMPILIGIGGIAICIAILNPKPIWMTLGIVFFIGLSYWMGVRRYDATYNLFYDANHLYLKNSRETIKIELNRIKTVKLTMSKLKIFGIQFNEYKIEFHQTFKMMDSVKFWSAFDDSTIREFEEVLRANSPDIPIDHSRSIFD